MSESAEPVVKVLVVHGPDQVCWFVDDLRDAPDDGMVGITGMFNSEWVRFMPDDYRMLRWFAKPLHARPGNCVYYLEEIRHLFEVLR